MSEKIRVNLTYRDCYSLLSDMRLFRYVGEDGEPTMNAFFNDLVRNYYQKREKQNEAIASDIDEMLRHLKPETANALRKMILSRLSEEEEAFPLPHECSFSFRPSKENEETFSYIEANLLGGRSLSAYYRALFHRYLSLTSAERERILFAPSVEKVEASLKARKAFLLPASLGGGYFYPFVLKTTREERMNYVLGLNAERECYTYHLFKLRGITLTQDSFRFSEEEKKALFAFASSAIEYASDEYVKAEIRLTRRGEKMYKGIFHNRPAPVKQEEGVYTFIAPDDQLFTYFIRFGKEAEVLSPVSLRRDFRKFYHQAYKVYQEPGGSVLKPGPAPQTPGEGERKSLLP